MRFTPFSAATLALVVCIMLPASADTILEAFDARSLPEPVEVTGGDAKLVRSDGGRVLQVRGDAGASVRVAYEPTEGTWDWSEGNAGVGADITNNGQGPVEVFVRIDSDENGSREVSRMRWEIAPGESATARIFFDNYGAGLYWGMRGIPEIGPFTTFGPRAGGFGVAPEAVSGIQFSITSERAPVDVTLDDIRLFPKGSPLEALAPHPFIDQFGQYMHDDWPGKISSEGEFAERRAAEDKALTAAPALPGRDRFGGWADGPQLEATGWFRTEKVDGKWWLVDPEGHLFFSIGVNSLYHGDPTFVSGRETWFEGLPADDSPFAQFYGQRDGVHSMADPIGGKGRTYNFHAANFLRKYGEDWPQAYQQMVYRRLPAWGLNTLGAWAGGDVMSEGPLPFTPVLYSGGVRDIEGSSGFWGKMKDVYDPEYAAKTDEAIARSVAPYKDNPLCIGYFVDNELSWGGISYGALISPVDQPARQVLVKQLQEKYGSIDALNKAWGSDAADWDALKPPARQNAAVREDFEDFDYAFAKRYAEAIAAALEKHAPNQLYLGCRFTLAYSNWAAFRGVAEHVDVFSINAYVPEVDCAMWTGEKDLGKPIMIGEFHFGALDRGMFHQGLVATESQKDRGETYRRYLKSVAECPAFVGCHWFQYMDQATTGRSMDGENYSVGLVTVVDEPHHEFLEHVKNANGDVYRMRAEAK